MEAIILRNPPFHSLLPDSSKKKVTAVKASKKSKVEIVPTATLIAPAPTISGKYQFFTKHCIRKKKSSIYRATFTFLTPPFHQQMVKSDRLNSHVLLTRNTSSKSWRKIYNIRSIPF